MVETQEIRDAFAARLNRALDDRPEVRKGRGRNVDMHAALKRFGVEATTQGTNKWLRAESMPEKDKMRQLAAWLGVRAQWLEYGEGSMLSAEGAGQLKTAENIGAYLTPEASRLYRYPMVSSVAAGIWQEAIQPFEPGGEDVFELTDYKAKGQAFWLAVEGDSMTWSGAPSIPEGHLILVDTGLEANPGDLVVAKLDTDDKATFKKLVRESGQLYLKPLNPAYEPIKVDAGCRIIGVVKEAKLKL